MKRYIRSNRTNNHSREDQLRDQFLRDLAKESEKILQQLSQRYMQDLQNQTNQLLQSAAGLGTVNNAAGAPSTLSFIGGAGQLLSTTFRFLAAKPRTSESSVETTRSQEVDARFRVSQAQAMAEASAAIAKGNKNL